MENTIYLGKYVPAEKLLDVPDVIELPESEIVVLSQYLGEDEGGHLLKDDRTTIVIKDDNFWPVICKLEDKEVKQLIAALRKIMKARKRKKEEQVSEIVGFNIGD